MNRRAFPLIATCLAAVMASAAHADNVYRWVDSEGKVHYSSTPPAGTGVGAQKVDVTAPQVVNMVAPPQPQLLSHRPKPHADNSLSKDKADAIDKQIKDLWGQCRVIGQQLDDLRNDVSPNPVTHTKLTAAQRDAMERTLEAQQKHDCSDIGG